MTFDKSIISNETYFISHCDADRIIPFVLNIFFKLSYGKETSTNYGELIENEFIPQYKNIVFVDFSPSETTRELIEKYNINCLIIDHHEGTKNDIDEWCKKYNKVEYIFDNNKCGTKLYYEWLKEQGFIGNSVVDYIVDLTDTYDLYKQDSELWNIAEKFNRLLYTTAHWYIKDDRLKCYEFFINTMIWKMKNANNFFFNEIEEAKIKEDIDKENNLFDDLIRNAVKNISTRRDEKGHYFSIFYATSKISALANRLLNKYKKLEYVIIINDYNKNDIKISLRSKDDFDLLQLNGCSGHKNACGIDSNKINTKEFAEKLWKKEIYCLNYLD